MLFNGLRKSIKNEIRSFSSNLLKLSAFGALFTALAMIVLYAGSSPLWMKNYRIFPGGAFVIFVCYLSSVIFFFLCGMIVCSMLMCKRSFGRVSSNVILHIVAAYVFRMLWIILFFGGFSPLFALVCLIASTVFLIFSLINTSKVSIVLSAITAIMVIFSIVFIILTLKFMLIP